MSELENQPDSMLHQETAELNVQVIEAVNKNKRKLHCDQALRLAYTTNQEAVSDIELETGLFQEAKQVQNFLKARRM